MTVRPFLLLLALVLSAPLLHAQPVSSDSVRSDSAAFVLRPAPVPALPVRTVAERAGLLPGLRRDPVGDGIRFRGFEGATYVVDGLRVTGTPDVPAASVAAVETPAGLVPARIGNALGAVVEVETRADAPALTGAAEGLGSDGLDAYGYRLGALSFGVPVVPGRLAVFAAAEVRRAADADPRSGGYVRVDESVLEDLRAAPSALYAVGPGGDIVYFPVPGDLPAGTDLDAFAATLDVPAGYALSEQTVARSVTLDPAAFSRGAADNPAEALRLQGGLTAAPVAGLTLRLDGQWRQDEGQQFEYRRAVFNPESVFRVESDAWRLAGHVRQQLGARGWMRLGVSADGSSRVTYDPRFSSNVEDALFYGDIDAEANAVAARYYQARSDNWGEPFYLVPRYSDWNLAGAETNGLVFPAPGLPGLDPLGLERLPQQALYETTSSARTVATLDGGIALGAHRLSAGVEVERETARGYRLFARRLAVYFSDAEYDAEGNLIPGTGIEFFVPGLPLVRVTPAGDSVFGVSEYSQLPAAAFGTGTFYYGYDIRGLEEANGQDLDAYFAGSSTDVAPRRTHYAAAYAEDAVDFGAAALTLGLRVEAYGSNALDAFDPWALYPIERVRDLPGTFFPPDEAGDDWAVYYDHSDEIVGYRDLDGRFYDASGVGSTAREIVTQLNGSPRSTDAPQSEAFQEASTHVLVLPRLSATVPVVGGGELYLFYNALAQAPPRALAFPFPGELNTTFGFNSPPIATVALRPERTHDAGLGVRMRLGETGRLGVSTFYRRYRDLVGLRQFASGFPQYVGYMNLYDPAVYGATAAAGVEVGGLQAHVSLTAQREPLVLTTRFADPLLVDSPWSGHPPPTTADAEGPAVWVGDLTVSTRYALARGPAVGGLQPLSGLRLGGVLQARTGAGYYRRSLPGGVARTPSFVQLDLRAEKAFGLGGGASVTAAVWVENVLGRENVVGVYPGSGRPDAPDFGFENEPDLTIERTLDPAATRAQYDLLARNPAFYGRPRQIRFGLALRY